MLPITTVLLLSATHCLAAIDLSKFTAPCKVDADCLSGTCLTGGPYVNGDAGYHYCDDMAACDPTAAQRADGSCNNMNAGRRMRGSTGHMQLRRVNGTFTGTNGPRNISDTVGDSPTSIPNNFGTSGLLVFFGQFIDHDITLVHEGEATSLVYGSGDVPDITFTSTAKIGGAGEQPMIQNFITSWLDLTQVYGYSEDIENTLRKHSGGEMAQTWLHGKEYLPANANLSIEMAMGSLPGAFAAGDIRANENIVLSAFHTLFLREHNRLARQFAAATPSLTDEEVYQKARRWNIAQYQNIVLDEYFGAWFGESLPAYSGYDDEETPDIDIVFSTAAFRFGHSAIPHNVRRIDENGADYSMELSDAFFAPLRVLEDGGVDSLLKGVMQVCHERVDTRVVDALRNALFDDIPGTNTSVALDLLTLNLARGRDHQLPKYTDLRAFFDLSVPSTFGEVTGGDACLTSSLEDLYGIDNVQACDPMICGLAEAATRGHMGELFFAMQRDQFRRFRDADRFYFENTNTYGSGLTGYDIQEIKDTKLHHILRRNTFMNDDGYDLENYVVDAFYSGECCQTGGNGNGGGADTMCVVSQAGGAEWAMVDHCTALDAIRNEPVHFAGTENFDCSCNYVEPVECAYAEDGNLEVLLPPLLDETSTHVVFNVDDDSAFFEVTIRVPKQYTTAKFDFENAANDTGAYDSTSFDDSLYWTHDYQSDPCNTIYTGMIPWDLFRSSLGGMSEQRFADAVCYNTQVNINVTKELEITPHTLLLDFTQEHTRVVRNIIPFEVCFETTLKLWGDADVLSDHLRVAAALIDTSVLTVDPDASPLAKAYLELVTVIPLPLMLDAATIAVSEPLLSHGLTIAEIVDQRDCEPQESFCTQYWQVYLEPEQCTLNGDFTAEVHGACHPGVTNCIEPTPAYDDIVMYISSDDFCGVTQEIDIQGSLTLDATECNSYMHGSVSVFNGEGFPINTTEIVKVDVYPTLAGSQFLTVYDASTTRLDYSATLVNPDQVDFQFLWQGSELRCDVIASVDVMVRVEYEATAASQLLSIASGRSGSSVSLLSDDQDMRMSAQAAILQDTNPTLSPSDSDGVGTDAETPAADEAGGPGGLFGFSLLQTALVGGGAVLAVLLAVFGFVYCCRASRASSKRGFRPSHVAAPQEA